MVRRSFVAMAIGCALVAAGCGSGRSSSPTRVSTPPGAETGSPVAPGTPAAGEAPIPEHLTFGPGETIAADGRAGIFFLDPKTGAADGWVVPATRFPGPPDVGVQPFTFTIGGVSADGARIVYECLEAQESAAPRPCGGSAQHLWYLLDTETGARTRLSGYDGGFLSISPDGETLLGVQGGVLGFAPADKPSDARAIALPAGDAPLYADWAPDSGTVVVSTGVAGVPTAASYLVPAGGSAVVPLPIASPALDWSADGSKLAVASQDTRAGAHGTLAVLSRDGTPLWSRAIDSFSPNPRWSADGSLLSLTVYDQLPSPTAQSGIERVDVYDGATGATAYRVIGAIACQGPVWAGDSDRLIVGHYGNNTSLVDLAAGTMAPLSAYVTPEPADSGEAIVFDGKSFSTLDLTTGALHALAGTTVGPSWDPLHGLPLFAGGRIMFTALHSGHGGCGEGASPDNPPKLAVQRGPFADDGPVTRGGG